MLAEVITLSHPLMFKLNCYTHCKMLGQQQATKSVASTVEQEQEQENSMAHEKWCKNRQKTALLVEASLIDVATKLDSKDLLSSTLYDNIVSLSDSPPEGHRTTLLFHILERRLKSEDKVTVDKTWQAIMVALKTEWKDLATRMEQSWEDEKRDNPEYRVLKLYKESLILLIQGSLVMFAEIVASKEGLSDNEKHQVTDQNYKWQEKYVGDMLDEVGKQINEKPSVLKDVIKIFRKIGGPLTDLADALEKPIEKKPIEEPPAADTNEKPNIN